MLTDADGNGQVVVKYSPSSKCMSLGAEIRLATTNEHILTQYKRVYVDGCGRKFTGKAAFAVSMS
jgi:hypothetical protein